MHLLSLFLFFLLFSDLTFACRNVIHHKSFLPEEALEQAALILSGSVVGHQRPTGTANFKHTYQIKIDKVWKGSFKENSIYFSMEHHSCAKYPQEFPITKEAAENSGRIILYFAPKSNADQWLPLRIVGIYSNQSKDSDAELVFLKKAR